MTEQTALVVQSNFLSPAVNVKGALERYNAVNQFIGSILKSGTDYGKVPGSDKPTLLKPGAEKLASFFGLSPRFSLEEKVEDWTGENHGGEPFFYYRYKCQLFKNDLMIADGEGSCNSWEKKYRYRQTQRKCPTCGQSTIIKGKAEYGGGWVCFKNKGGCGAKFKDNDKSITDQEVGQTKNPDPAEQVNTIQKMAQKRALIAPVLIATNASEKFTQDIEDFVDGDFHEATPEPEQPKVEQIKPEVHSDDPELEKALNTTGSDGKRYGDCTDKELLGKKIGLEKGLAEGKLDNAGQAKYQEKLEAIALILKSRSAGPTA